MPIDIHKYIIDTFQSFLKYRTTLTINYFRLDKSFNEEDNFLDLFLFKRNKIELKYKSKFNLNEEWEESKFKRRDSNDYSNLIKPEIFQLFPNIKTIYIDIGAESSDVENYHTSYLEDCKAYHTLSFIALLSIIKDTNVQQVNVETTGLSMFRKSWLEVLWETQPRDIIEEYRINYFHIKFEHLKEDDRFGYICDRITIERT